MLTTKNLEALKEIDIESCDKKKLVDLKDVNVSREKSVEERTEEFLIKIKNPYLFKVGEVTVKINFNSEGKTFTEALEGLLSA